MNKDSGGKLLSTVEVAQAIGAARSSVHRWAVQHPGFAVQVGGRWKVPEPHLARLLSGETIASIAQSPSSADQQADVADADGEGTAATMIPSNGPGNEEAPEYASTRQQLLTAYFLVLGMREHGDNMAPETRDRLMWRIGDDLRQAIKALRVYEPGGIRDAIRAVGALEEYRVLTGISAQI